MSRGSPWTPADTATLERMAGRARDADIAEATGHSVWTVGVRRKLLGLPAYHPKRTGWSRRDYLLAGAAGLYAPELV